jgi:hypothetical protein
MAIYLSLGLHDGSPSYIGEASRSQKRAFKQFKTIYFFTFFSFFVGRLSPRGFGSGTKVNADPDPQHWGKLYFFELKYF